MKEEKLFAIILMMFVRYKMLLKPPPPYLLSDTDDFGSVILLNLFYQYSKQRKRPLPFYNMTIRNKIIENWEHDNYVINYVYSLIIRRPYDFWMLTGENPNSFHTLVGLVAGNITGHGNMILSVTNRILMTLIWLRQYHTYALLSLNFGLSVSTINHIIRHTWIKLWEVFSPIVVWPTPEEWLNKRGKWHEMPNVVGMIDGTSHEILVPMNEPQQDFYSGHRKYHCIHTQVFIDHLFKKSLCNNKKKRIKGIHS